MRKRFNFLTAGIALAILSFAYARYDYYSSNTATIAIGKSETQIKNPLMSHDLFGDWMEHEKLFAIVLPVAFIASGVVLAVKK
jgi:hypothetical protein